VPTLSDVSWVEALGGWSTALRAAGRAPGTVRVRVSYVERFALEVGVGPWAVTGDDVAAWLARGGWAPETRKSARASVRSFYGWAVDTGRLEHSPAERAPSVRVPPAPPRPAPDTALARALLRADRAEVGMVLLAAYMGLRRAEVAAVHSGDLGEHGLTVRGKGGRVRVVPVHPQAAAWLADVDGWAFPGRAGGHVAPDVVGRHLSRLLGPGWTGHTLRHRFATRAYGATGDVLALRDVLGHASVATTQRYVDVGADRRARLVEAVT